MKHISPCFVYGTLRVGEGNYDYIKECVVRVDENVTTPGHLWFRHTGSYPIARFIPGGDDLIIGDVLWCDQDNPAYCDMMEMELQSGYALAEIEARLSDGSVIDVVGFHYLGTPQSHLFIPSGDWKAAVRSDVCTLCNGEHDRFYDCLEDARQLEEGALG